MPHKNIEDRRRYAKEYAATHPEYREKRALHNRVWREKNKEKIFKLQWLLLSMVRKLDL